MLALIDKIGLTLTLVTIITFLLMKAFDGKNIGDLSFVIWCITALLTCIYIIFKIIFLIWA